MAAVSLKSFWSKVPACSCCRRLSFLDSSNNYVVLNYLLNTVTVVSLGGLKKERMAIQLKTPPPTHPKILKFRNVNQYGEQVIS